MRGRAPGTWHGDPPPGPGGPTGLAGAAGDWNGTRWNVDIEIVICSYNRAALLARTLAYLDQADIPTECSVTIKVVLNACTDDSIATIREYARRRAAETALPLRWVEEPRRGKSSALNRAIRETEAAVLAFVDDDHRVDRYYLTALCRAVTEYQDSSVFCGRILPDWDGREPVWAHMRGEFAIYPLPVPRYDQGPETRMIDEGGPIPGGGNLFVRRAVFDRVGVFSEELGPKGHNLGGGEDSDFVMRALAGGERLRYVPDAVQYHYVDGDRLKLGYLLRKSYQRSLAVTWVRRQERRLPPRYLWRKLAGYLWHTTTSLYWPQTRFYLVRIAAILGEIRGHLKSDRPGSMDGVR